MRESVAESVALTGVAPSRFASYVRLFTARLASLPGHLDLLAHGAETAKDCLALARRILANPWLPSHHVACARIAETLLLGALLRRYSINTVIDVGAHHGEFGRSVRAAGFRGELVSIEPDTASAQRLRYVAADDQRWRVVEAAASIVDGEGDLLSFADSSFNSTRPPTASGTALFDALAAQTVRAPVRLATLDSLLSAGELGACTAPVLLKSDTQGSDLDVLRGAARVMDRCEVLLVELATRPLYEGAPTALSTWRYLRHRQFRLASLHDVSSDPASAELIELNGIFVRASH